MADTAARLLRMLSLFQGRPQWTAAELAERLLVTPRTVRRDIVRLRDLGYPLEAEPGPHGGYRWGPDGRLPPLLLDDDEAVAVAVGLRAAADGSIAGQAEAAQTALAKLEQVLPARLAEQVHSISLVTDDLAARDPDVVDPHIFTTVAGACRRGTRVRIGYVDRQGRASERRVDPFRLVRMGPRWYLVARDVAKGEWRTLRLDRVVEVASTGHRVELGDPPDAVALVRRANAVAPYAVTATLRLPLPLAETEALISRTVGVHRADGPDHTVVEVGGGSVAGLARWVAGLATPVAVVGPPELRAEVVALSEAMLQLNRAEG